MSYVHYDFSLTGVVVPTEWDMLYGAYITQEVLAHSLKSTDSGVECVENGTTSDKR